jgi:hypothetical protein
MGAEGAVTKPTLLRRYLGLIVPFFLAAVLAAGYYAFWTKAAHHIEAQVRASLGVNGATSIKVDGFPYRLTLNINDLDVAAANGVRFKSSSLVMTATPFNPLLWVLEGALEPTLALPSGPLRPLKATNLKASLRLRSKGLERFSLTFDGLAAGGDGGWQVGKGLFHVMTRFEDDVSLAMVMDLKAVRIAEPLEGPGAILGQTIDHIFISGPVDQRAALMRSTNAWRDAGGKFTMMAGQIIWGPVYLTQAKGALSLSANNKWQGNISGQGALKPEGIAVAALSTPIDLQIDEGQLSLSGLPGLNLSDVFR